MTLKELMPLRSACENFLKATQDEVHGDWTDPDFLNGQLDRILYEIAVLRLEDCGFLWIALAQWSAIMGRAIQRMVV